MTIQMMARLAWIVLVMAVLPCSQSQTDVDIHSFSFAEADITFVPQQPKTFYIILALQTDQPVTRSLEFLFYFRDGNGAKLVEHLESKQETFPSGSPITVFRVTEDDALTVTLPATTTCASGVQYSFCVNVTVLETGGTKLNCLDQTSFNVVCERPNIELEIVSNLTLTDLYQQNDLYYLSLSFTMNMTYIGDNYASFLGTNNSQLFNLVLFIEDDTGTSIIIGNTPSEKAYSYTISTNSPATISIEESVVITDCKKIDLGSGKLCANVTPGRDAIFDLDNYDKNTKCTSTIPDNIKCPADTSPFFLALIGALVALVIFIVLVCIVCIRFKNKIQSARFWVHAAKTPEEAYNIIKRRLNVKSFYEKDPYVVDTQKPTDVDNLDMVNIGDEEDAYSHLRRSELLNSGTNNPAFSTSQPYDEKNHPYEGELQPGDLHPYEHKLQETSGGSTSSQHKIRVDIENAKNTRKDSGNTPDSASSSYETAKLQDNSGGSYVEASQPYDRRKPSINPVKPEVDYQRNSLELGASLDHEKESSVHGRGSLGYERSLHNDKDPSTDHDNESELRGSKPRSSFDALGMAPPLPPGSTEPFPHIQGSTEPPPILKSQRPPSKKPKPKKQPPKPKPKPKPPTPRPSLEVDSKNKLPESVSNKPRPSMSHFNITGGGSTKMSAEFRRPSIFRTNSSENILPPSKQNKQMFPEILQLALNANQMGSGKSNRLSRLMPGTGTLKRTQAEFASAALENFLALVDEIENPKENDERQKVVSDAGNHADEEVPERPRRVAATRPMSVRRNSTPFLLETSDRKLSKMSNISEGSFESYASYESDIYVNKWNKGWEFDRGHLMLDRESPLGEGQFGKVYKGIAFNIAGRMGDTPVAVKVLKNSAKIEDKDEFLKELAIHTLIEPHENVIELLGCCIRDEPLCIIIEFMQNGSLLRYLRKQEKTKSLAQYLMVRFGYQIALGMQHVANMGIVHRDLAARNILVDDQLICKVSDFGFARDVFGVKTYNKAPEKAPIRWYAPEAILDDTFTSKTDVWSFGILLFEIITMGYLLPYHRDPSSASVRLTIATGGVPPQPVYCNDELYSVMRKCWHREPDDRPDFEELAESLNQLQSKYELRSPYGESDA
ncbi:uncharacterized protein [Amphiura filiformis]|uniref:uncharacterized protein isoform X2 n=1 Tax=Amphiura filiformis TaxID=82378 RepID=UPI003B20F8C4